MTLPNNWDDEYDVVVVGTGAAGMTAAVTAAKQGLTSLLIEKADLWGGTTAYSGGGIWIPANRLQLAAGIKDSIEEAEKYLDIVVTDEGPSTAPEKRKAFLNTGPKMIDMLIGEGIQWTADVHHPDYESDKPHASIGRDLDSKFFDAKKLGAWQKTMRRSPAPYAIRLQDIPYIGQGLSTPTSIARMAYVYFRHKILTALGQDQVGCGQSLAAQLMSVVQKLKIPVWLSAPMKQIVFEDGKAIGLVVSHEGKTVRVGARHGVVLAAGGFAHEKEFRSKHQGADGRYSQASDADTGDAIKLSDEIGAMTAMMGEAWWGPVSYYPDPAGGPGLPVFVQWERSLPHSICVSEKAERFTDEAEDYYQFAQAMRREKVQKAWLIIDSRHRNRYVFGAMFPGRTPKGLIDAGFFKKADTIEGLAAQCDLDPATLAQTIARFNMLAKSGKDVDFKRGDEPYDRLWGDPTKPNPNLGPVEKPPFYATPLYVGDIGTKGGLVINADAQVLDQNAAPIAGLYAAGNATASVMGRSYPGPGSTLGPAMTFGYIASKHISRRATNQ